MFNIEIANLVIGVDNQYDTVRRLSEDYLSDKEADFTVSVTQEEIESELLLLDDGFGPSELESIAIYRKIADKLCDFDAFVFHGAVVIFKERAYLFTAKSGVGKTTHIRLWLSRFGSDAEILNGDKPVLRIIDGTVYISGTPWRGKEEYGRPGMLPLSGIAFLERAEKNSAYPENPEDALMRFTTQAYIPKHNAMAGIKTLRLLDRVIKSVPLITLKCNMKEEAAEVAASAFSDAEFKKRLKDNAKTYKGDSNEQRIQ